MSKENDSIFKSLAALEQNLNDINSANEQINNVVKTSNTLAKTVETYQKSFENLSINVKSILDDSRKFNLDSITKLSEQTKNFSSEIAKLTEFDVSKSLKTIESESIKQFQQNLSVPLEDLNQQIENIEKEVRKLTEFDFQDSFLELEKQVISQFRTDLKEQLLLLDKKVIELQSRIHEFNEQILRIEKFDLQSQLKDILTNLTIITEKQSSKLVEKSEEIKSQGKDLAIRISLQEKEIRSLKTTLFVISGLILFGFIAIIIILQ